MRRTPPVGFDSRRRRPDRFSGLSGLLVSILVLLSALQPNCCRPKPARGSRPWRRHTERPVRSASSCFAPLSASRNDRPIFGWQAALMVFRSPDAADPCRCRWRWATPPRRDVGQCAGGPDQQSFHEPRAWRRRSATASYVLLVLGLSSPAAFQLAFGPPVHLSAGPSWSISRPSPGADRRLGDRSHRACFNIIGSLSVGWPAEPHARSAISCRRSISPRGGSPRFLFILLPNHARCSAIALRPRSAG